MDINKLLMGFTCDCGKTHHCDIAYVYIEDNAIAHLAELCTDYQDVLLVADENTYAAAGEKTENALSGKAVTKVIFSGSQILVPNEQAIEAVMQKTDGKQLIVGVGSGVIQDLCKYVSHSTKIPYMIVATAPSMDGYASDGAAMISEGMKVTYKTTLPRAIIADTKVLASAPMEMIKAGYGDIIGKFSALNDWQLSRCVNDEYFCQEIYDLTFRQIRRNLEVAQGIVNRDPESIRVLMEALVIVGILMSFAGSSRPASGSEHHLSHFFEITDIVDGMEYLPHGIDVAYSTVITADIREKLLQKDFPNVRYRQSDEAYSDEMHRVYKQVAGGCMQLQEKVGNYALDRTGVYLEKQQQIKAILAEMPTAGEISAMLSKVGMEMDSFYQFYGHEKIRTAVRYAKDLKDRYTVLWLFYDLFGGESYVP